MIAKPCSVDSEGWVPGMALNKCPTHTDSEEAHRRALRRGGEMFGTRNKDPRMSNSVEVRQVVGIHEQGRFPSFVRSRGVERCWQA